MGATELIQGLGRALAVLRENGLDQESLQELEDHVTALDAVRLRDADAGERWAARLVGKLYGLDTSAVGGDEPKGSFPLGEARKVEALGCGHEPVKNPEPVPVADQRAAGVAPEDTVTIADQKAGAGPPTLTAPADPDPAGAVPA